MEVPKSLQSTWNEVSKDNKITRQEYQKLVNAAAPDKKNEQFDKEEVAFLTKLKNEIGTKDSVSIIKSNKNSIESISFVDETSKDKVSAQGLIDKFSSSFKIFNNKPEVEEKATNEMQKILSSLSKDELLKLKNEMKSVHYGKSHVGVYHTLKTLINSEISKKELEKVESKPVEPSKEKPTAQGLINKYANSFQIFNNNPEAEKKAADEMQKLISSLSKEELSQLKEEMKSVGYPKSSVGVYHTLNNMINDEISKRGLDKTTDKTNEPSKEKPTAQGLINKYANAFQIFNNNPDAEKKAADEMQKLVSSLSKEELSQLKEEMKTVSYPKSCVGVYHTLNNMINDEITKRETQPSTNEPKPSNTNNLPPLPDSLKAKWTELSKDGEISADDYKQLVKEATPNNTKSEVSPEEYKFLVAIKNKVKEGNGVYKLATPENKPSTESVKFKPAYVPDTLKEVWNKISVDGKISKDEYKELIKAAAPKGKDVELDPQEIQFLEMLKQKFQGVEEVEVDKPAQKEEPKKEDPKPAPTETKIPSTLEALWKELSKDKEITVSDLKALIKAAKPNGKDEELDADEIKFLSELTSKMVAGNGVAKL